MVSAPVTSHTTNSQPAEPTWREMSAETMKMPEPIIEPATIMVESSRPRPWTNFASAGGAGVAVAGIICLRKKFNAKARRRKEWRSL